MDPNSFLRKFETVNETHVHHFKPETKQQSKLWKHVGSLPSKEAKTVMAMASSSLDAEGVLLVDYPDMGHTITTAYYAGLLRQLGTKIKQIWRGQLTRARTSTEMCIPACRRLSLFSWCGSLWLLTTSSR